MNSKQRGILCSNLLHLFFCKVFHSAVLIIFPTTFFLAYSIETWVLVSSFSKSPVPPEHSLSGRKFPCHTLFEGTRVNSRQCQEGDSSACSFSSRTERHQSITTNHYYCHGAILIPCSFCHLNPDSIHRCSWRKEHTQRDVQPQRGHFFRRGADWSCSILFATFPGSHNSARLADGIIDTQVGKSASITLPYHREILNFGKVYPDLRDHLSYSLLWKVSSNISCLSPFWNKHVHSSWWTDPNKNLKIPFQKAFLYLKL